MPPRPTVAVGAVAVDDAGRLLVVRRGRPPAAGRWSLPGGRVEPGESVQEALRREVREETGLDVEVGDLVGWLERRDDDHHFVILDLAVAPRDPDAVPVPGDDADEVRWMRRAELETAPTTDGLLAFLDHAGVRLA